MCFLTFKWQVFVNNALRRLFHFPFFFSYFLIKNTIDLKIVSFFKKIKMNCFH